MKTPDPRTFHRFKPATKHDGTVQNGRCKCGAFHYAYQHMEKKERDKLGLTEANLVAMPTPERPDRLGVVGYIHPLKGYRTVEQVEQEKQLEQQKAFDQYANVFNTPKQAMTFVAQHRPGYVVVKVGRKYVPATVAFAKRMGLKIITNNG